MKHKTILKNSETHTDKSEHNPHVTITFQQPKSTMISLLNSMKKKHSKLQQFQSFESTIPFIRNTFLSSYRDQTRANLFKTLYNDHLNGTYIDILLLIKEFPSFLIFDFINIIPSTEVLTKEKKEEYKMMVLARNNIIMSIIIVAIEVHFSEMDKEINFGQEDPLFDNLSFLNEILEEFKHLIMDNKNIVTIEYDVEFLFLALLGFRDIAKMIKQKHYKYFKKFLKECNIPSTVNFDTFLLVTLDKTEFSAYSNEELIIFRKILNNAAKRKFYYGFDYLLKNVGYCYILSEGRLWKSLGKHLTPEKVYDLWLLYRNYLELIRQEELRETLPIEYQKKLALLSMRIRMYENTHKKTEEIPEDMKTVYYQYKKLKTDIKLFFVTCLKELFVIFFQNDLKELVQYFFDDNKTTEEIAIPIDIYEICLEFDEDISIDIMNRSLTDLNANESYMHLALLKKYYRLARHLLKFSKCKRFLNQPAPISDEFLVLITKMEKQKRQKMIDHIKYQKDFSHEQTKILEFIKDRAQDAQLSKNNKSINNEGTSINIIKHNSQETKYDLVAKNSWKSKLLSLNKNEQFQQKDNNPLINSSPHFAQIQQTTDSRLDNNILTTSSNIKLLSNMNNINNDSTVTIKRNVTNPFNAFTQYFKKNFVPETNDNVSKITAPILEIKTNSSMDLPKVEIIPNKEKSNNGSCTPAGLNLRKSRQSIFFPNQLDNYTPQGKPTVLNQTDVSNENMQESIYSHSNRDFGNVFTLSKIKKGDLDIDVQFVLIEQLRFGENVCDCLCLLSSIEDGHLSSFNLSKIFSYLLYYTINEDAISKCSEPLLFVALAAEYLQKIGHDNTKILYKANTVKEEMLHLGVKLQSSMKDEDMLTFYLKDQCDYRGRNALEIYAQNRYYILLNDIAIGSIVNKIWSGTDHSSDLIKYLRLTRILQSDIFTEDYFSLVCSKLLKNSIYSFQYSQHIHNCSGKYILNSTILALIAIYYEICLYSFSIIDKEDHKRVFKLEYIGNALFYLSIIDFFCLIIFLYKTKRQIRIDIFEILQTTIMIILLTLNCINLPAIIFPNDDEHDVYLIFYSILLSLILVISWSRVMLIFLATNSYGPFLRILLNIFWEVFWFLIIVICITFLFAQVFTLFFQKSNPDFKFFFDGFIALFNTAFGQVNFDAVTSLDIFGYVCLITYSTLSNIMLFNLIVAIINNLFNQIESKANLESRAVQILTTERIRWDDQYGLLILLPAPLNIFSLPFIIALFFSENKTAQLNEIFSKICYILIALAFFLTLLILGILAYPFSLIKSLIHSTHTIWNSTMSIRDISQKLLTSFVFRPFELLWYFLEDLIHFWVLVYKSNNVNNNTKPQNEFNKDYIVAIRKILNDLRFKDQKKTIQINELYKKMQLLKNKQWFKKTKNHKKIISTIMSDHSSMSDFTENLQNNTITFGRNMINHFEMTEIMKEELKMKFRLLLDKIIDPEGIVDIERSLILLPYRVKYSKDYFENLKYMNIKVLIRGARKNAFENDNNNWRYAYKKLQLLIYKIFIKFKMMYTYIPEDLFKEQLRELNTYPQYQKNNNGFKIYEKKDNESEYDDEGECCVSEFHPDKNKGTFSSESRIQSDSESKDGFLLTS